MKLNRFKNKVLRDLRAILSILFYILSPGKIHSMRHLKNEVDSVKNGVECGLAFGDKVTTEEEGDQAEVFNPLEGDHVICYSHNHVTQTSSWDPGF